MDPHKNADDKLLRDACATCWESAQERGGVVSAIPEKVVLLCVGRVPRLFFTAAYIALVAIPQFPAFLSFYHNPTPNLVFEYGLQ